MTTNPIRIVLDVEVVEESPTGQATTGDGTSRTFAGWLGLLSVLEALLRTSELGPPDDFAQRSP